jgi:hypothetical protein
MYYRYILAQPKGFKMFGKLISEKQTGNIKIELFQKMNEAELESGKDLDNINTLEEFFLTTTVENVILSQCEIGKDEAKLFANYCETGEVHFVGDEKTNN